MKTDRTSAYALCSPVRVFPRVLMDVSFIAVSPFADVVMVDPILRSIVFLSFSDVFPMFYLLSLF